MILFLFICSFNTVSAQTTETFNSSTTWTAPVGVTLVSVECWGSGGSGGSSANNSSSGGGGGGAYSRSLSLVVVPGNNYTINVGVGGAAPGKNASGIVGGDTWFLSNSTVFAEGGSGGNSSGSGGAGGLGGGAGVGIGNDVTFSGGDGAAGTTVGGGGGYGAGSVAGGTQASGSTGGIAPFEGGNGGDGGDNANGSPGITPGGAGGGAYGRNNLGAAGANGQIKLTYTVSATPTITLGANPSVVEGTTSANLPYSATTNSPDQYSINYDATAEGQGFVDVNLTSLPASPIVLTVPGAAAVDTYNGTLTVRNSGTGEVSGNYAITVTVTAAASPPTITLGANPSVTQGGTTGNLPYTATTNSPDQYSIDYDGTAEGQGFTDVSLAALTASPIVLTVPGAAAPATYNGTLTVKNSGTGLTSGNYPISVTITPGTPTITITDANPSVVQGTTSANVPYSATTFSPDQYSINYDGNAEGQGFVDVNLTSLPASPIVLTVPGAAAVDTYNGTLTVRNSGTGEVSGNYAITVTVTAAASPPTITLGANPSVTQGGTTGNLPYTATTNSPDQYSIDYDGTAEGQGFTDVSLAALTASPIVLTVPGVAAPATYNGTLTVKNSSTGLTSGSYPITVTITTAANPPTITLGTNPTVCQGTTTANLTYSSITENPDQYSINFDATANAAGFVDITNNALPASPISISVPGGAPAAVYNAILTVRNSSTGLSSVNYVIKVTVNETPSTPIISGNPTVPENSDDFKYYITNAPSNATAYNWNVPSGWTITAGSTTSQITVKTGALGDNGNITVTVTNPCGTSPQGNFAVTVSLTTDHSLYNCTSCHITHNAPGSGLTNVAGNALLCQSCHSSTGAASAKAIVNGDNGTSSHAWDVLAVNVTKETNIPTDSEMALRIVDNKIICSTCHDQHNTSVGTPHLRISNTGDALCKDCHSARDVGIYSDAPSTNKGSHPVGITYDGGDSRFNASPTNTQLVGGNVECSSCHGVHDVTGTLGLAANGNLLRMPNDNALCADCHNYGTHNAMNCLDCHTVHNNNKNNIYMIRNTIATPNSGDKTVVFTSETGTNSFADGDATYDGVCEVCHTSTSHYMNDGLATDQSHTSQGGQNGSNCMTCHPHNADFAPAGGCTECHVAAFPNFGITDAHFEHTSKYLFSCNTCHLNYGSGGSLEPSHPDSTLDTDNTMITPVAAEVNFDTAGMATRNGQDANTPIFNGDKTCDNIYCHSNGRTAHRGQEDNYDSDPWDPDTNPNGLMEWSGSIGPQTATYITTPAWDSGNLTVCSTCHGAAGNMNPDYTITNTVAGPVTGTGDVPPFDSHTRGAHISNSQNLSGNGWSHVQCFWCHNANNGTDASPNLQGTYSTSWHVDGESYFKPKWYSNGGTMVNTITYSSEGSAGHCGDGKTCW
jgi:predicted CxxxxCH...CXXCH cytochrome family protein